MQIRSFYSHFIQQWNQSEETPISEPIDEKAKTQDLKESAAGYQSHVPVRSPSTNSIVSEAEATSSPFVKKYKMDTGGKKVNVRIFKEPPAD